jgi:predicted nucleic acid-binding protein
MVFYIETSAFVKLLADEAHSTQMRDWVRGAGAEYVSSDLLRIEAMRSSRRRSPQVVKAAREAISGVDLIRLTSDICEVAAHLDPAIMRSLDAAHVATALSVGDELEGVITYDRRLAEACGQLGLAVVAPGAEKSS